MEANEFVKNYARMCKRQKGCDDCPLFEKGCYVTKYGKLFPDKLDEKMVDIVEKWANEHPIKTRQTEFLKMFPNASIIANGTLGICPRSLDKDRACFYQYSDHDGTKVLECLDCRNQFWLEEVDE